MNILERVEECVNNSQFKEYKQNNPESYLAHIFMAKNNEEVGYYNPKTDMVTTFSLSTFEKTNEDGVFKEEESKVLPLELNEVKISPEKAIEIFDKLISEKYSAEKISQEIQLLQNINGDIVYNTTLVTGSLKIINIRLNAQTGEIIREESSSIMKLG